jgi:hypothetical protein
MMSRFIRLTLQRISNSVSAGQDEKENQKQQRPTHSQATFPQLLSNRDLVLQLSGMVAGGRAWRSTSIPRQAILMPAREVPEGQASAPPMLGGSSPPESDSLGERPVAIAVLTRTSLSRPGSDGGVRQRDWNAYSYDTVSAPQQAWGAAVVERLSLRGTETVLDAGAGTGRVTEMLLERVPEGRAIAVDASPAMCG